MNVDLVASKTLEDHCLVLNVLAFLDPAKAEDLREFVEPFLGFCAPNVPH